MLPSPNSRFEIQKFPQDSIPFGNYLSKKPKNQKLNLKTGKQNQTINQKVCEKQKEKYLKSFPYKYPEIFFFQILYFKHEKSNINQSETSTRTLII
jgi:hypothetical protein